MPKQRINVSIDPELLREVDRNCENRSQLFEELARKWADMEKSKNEDLVRRRNKIKEELEDLRDEKSELQKRIDNLENELDAIEYALEKESQEDEEIGKAAVALADEWSEIRRRVKSNEAAYDKLKTTEKFGMWEDQIDVSREELMEAVKEEVDEPV